MCHLSSFAQEPPETKTIPVTEIKEEQAEGPAKITLREVEEVRVITAQRIYGLICVWVAICLVILLIRIQIRDDEKLHEAGYYEKDLH